MDLYKILPLKYARFLPPLPLLSSCIFHEDFQGSPEPSLKEPRAFPKVMHIHQCMWKLVRGTEGRMQTCPDFASPCSPAAAPTPGPASPPRGSASLCCLCSLCMEKHSKTSTRGRLWHGQWKSTRSTLLLCCQYTQLCSCSFFYFNETLEVM